MKITKAAILSSINEPLEIDDLMIPELKKGQVLVKIVYSGICHTQLNEIRGLKGEDKFLPHTLGHEGSGVVVDVGPDVQKVKIGDHVVLTWIKGEGIDVPSTQYQMEDGSIVNSGAISTFMEYAVISENRLVAIDKRMPLKEAALLGCAIPTGAGIVINTIKLTQGKSIAIFGIGGIGSSALLAARMKEAGQIIAVDVSDDKLTFARSLGATHTVNVKKEEVFEAIRKITNGRGVDYAIESAGKKESMEAAFKSVCDKGGLCVVAGNLSKGEMIHIDPFDLIKGKRIIGTWGGEARPGRDIPLYVDLFLSEKLDLSKLIDQSFPLADIGKGLARLEKLAVGRVMLDMTKTI